jgi:hypothetical protein
MAPPPSSYDTKTTEGSHSEPESALGSASAPEIAKPPPEQSEKPGLATAGLRSEQAPQRV